jgi:hypothetical protein
VTPTGPPGADLDNHAVLDGLDVDGSPRAVSWWLGESRLFAGVADVFGNEIRMLARIFDEERIGAIVPALVSFCGVKRGPDHSAIALKFGVLE